MSDKRFEMLDPLDQRLRRAIPAGQASGVQLRVDKIVGFELFNTRSYHNYETWSDGYHVLGPVGADGWVAWPRFEAEARASGLDDDAIRRLWRIASGSMQELLSVEAEDLDVAVDLWLDRREKVRAILAESPAGENQRTRLAVLGYHFEPEKVAG